MRAAQTTRDPPERRGSPMGDLEARGPAAAEEPRVLRGRAALAGAGDWRQHHDFQPGQRRAPAIAAGQEPRRARAPAQHRRRRRADVARRREQRLHRSRDRAPREHVVLPARVRAAARATVGSLRRVRLRAVLAGQRARRRPAGCRRHRRSWCPGNYHAGARRARRCSGARSRRTTIGRAPPPVAVISYRYWQRRFAAVPASSAPSSRSTASRPRSSA